jgi:hypothetical protein
MNIPKLFDLQHYIKTLKLTSFNCLDHFNLYFKFYETHAKGYIWHFGKQSINMPEHLDALWIAS